MDLRLSRFHYAATRVPRTNPNHGSSGPFYKNGTLYRLSDKRNRKGCREHIP